VFGSNTTKIFLLGVVLVAFSSFTMPNRLLKKALKEIEKTFNVKEVQLIPFELKD